MDGQDLSSNTIDLDGIVNISDNPEDIEYKKTVEHMDNISNQNEKYVLLALNDQSQNYIYHDPTKNISIEQEQEKKLILNLNSKKSYTNDPVDLYLIPEYNGKMSIREMEYKNIVQTEYFSWLPHPYVWATNYKMKFPIKKKRT